MQEEIKAIRTMKEFIAWYEAKEELDIEQSLQGDLQLHKFYSKFKYILEQENEENRKNGLFFGIAMENQKTIVGRINKELEELENDITALVEWHDENHKSISGINWKELEKVEALVKKIKKYISKK